MTFETSNFLTYVIRGGLHLTKHFITDSYFLFLFVTALAPTLKCITCYGDGNKCRQGSGQARLELCEPNQDRCIRIDWHRAGLKTCECGNQQDSAFWERFCPSRGTCKAGYCKTSGCWAPTFQWCFEINMLCCCKLVKGTHAQKSAISVVRTEGCLQPL